MTDVSDFQIYLKQSPLGVVYENTSPKLGIMDNELKIALQKMELAIANSIDNRAVIGLIVSADGKIRTTVNDVKRSVSLIEGFNKSAQALLENLDNTLNEPTPTAAKQGLSDDEAIGQFESAVSTDSQQIGKSQLDIGNNPVSEVAANPPEVVASSVDNRFMKLAAMLFKLSV